MLQLVERARVAAPHSFLLHCVLHLVGRARVVAPHIYAGLTKGTELIQSYV